MAGTRLRVKTIVSTEKAPETSDASTMVEAGKEGESVQIVGCSECPDHSSEDKVSTSKRCAQVDDTAI